MSESHIKKMAREATASHKVDMYSYNKGKANAKKKFLKMIDIELRDLRLHRGRLLKHHFITILGKLKQQLENKK